MMIPITSMLLVRVLYMLALVQLVNKCRRQTGTHEQVLTGTEMCAPNCPRSQQRPLEEVSIVLPTTARPSCCKQGTDLSSNFQRLAGRNVVTISHEHTEDAPATVHTLQS